MQLRIIFIEHEIFSISYFKKPLNTRSLALDTDDIGCVWIVNCVLQQSGWTKCVTNIDWPVFADDSQKSPLPCCAHAWESKPLNKCGVNFLFSSGVVDAEVDVRILHAIKWAYDLSIIDDFEFQQYNHVDCWSETYKQTNSHIHKVSEQQWSCIQYLINLKGRTPTLWPMQNIIECAASLKYAYINRFVIDYIGKQWIHLSMVGWLAGGSTMSVHVHTIIWLLSICRTCSHFQ